jgi:hypothetical protein
VANSPDYPDSAADGYGQLSGRVASFAYDAQHGRLYAAASQGGVWESDDTGQTWRSIGNGLPTQVVGAVGYTPARGGTVIAATGDGVTIDPKTDWQQVFDLGTRGSPGNATAAGSAPNDSENQVSAVAVRGSDGYVGYCGSCDPVLAHALFGNGIATNVGGAGAPAAGSPAGWHVAAARGLPHRIITSIAIDRANPGHIFVTLGSSTLRPYVPAGALGNDGVSVTSGAVYESFDAGNDFTDVTANLPQIGAAWVAFHRRQLVVADTVGVFASTTNVPASKFKRLRYGVLGKGLPHASVFSLAFSPADPDLMVAATFGRGVWTYRF